MPQDKNNMGLDSKNLPQAILSKMSKEARKPLGKAGMTASECQAVQVAKSEAELQKQIQSLLRRRGYIVARQRMDKKSNSQEGLPDIFFACGSKAIFMECKFGKGVLSDEQEKVLKALAYPPNSAQVFVVRSYAQGVQILDELEAKC